MLFSQTQVIHSHKRHIARYREQLQHQVPLPLGKVVMETANIVLIPGIGRSNEGGKAELLEQQMERNL